MGRWEDAEVLHSVTGGGDRPPQGTVTITSSHREGPVTVPTVLAGLRLLGDDGWELAGTSTVTFGTTVVRQLTRKRPRPMG